MSSNDKPAAPRVMDVTLEFVGNIKKDVSNSNSNGSKPVVKKLAKSATSVRFIVQKLPSIVDAETADHVTAVLLDELDRLPVPGRVAKVQLSNLKFTEQGAVALQGFLASHAATIRHVILNGLVLGTNTNNDSSKSNGKNGKKESRRKKTKPDDSDSSDSSNSSNSGEPIDSTGTLADSQRVAQIITAFAKSPLTVLDFSRNVIHGPILWKPWKRGGSGGSTGVGTSLKQLILDSVDMDHESWVALPTAFVWSNLDDLHVVLDEPMSSDDAVDAACTILRKCTKLSSLRWIQKRGSNRPLPWVGLRDMASARLAAAGSSGAAASSGGSVASARSNNNGGSLKHLVLEGPGTPDFMKPQDLQDLSATLKDAPRLKTLKLRHLGIRDLSSICTALRSARPPLEVIDFSYNEVTSAGCLRLTDLMSVSRIANQLVVLVMNDNRIETSAAQELLEAFSTAITMDNNPGVDFTQLIADVLTAKGNLEQERDELRLRLETRAYEAGGDNTELLMKENRRLREERDSLSRAFSIMGISHQVDEHRRLLERVQRLEDLVVLGAVFKDGGVAVRGNSNHGGHGVMGGMSGVDAMAGKNPSRRRINVNELDRLTQAAAAAAAAAAGRNPSGRSLSRSHSNRSTTSRGNSSLGTGSASGGTTNGTGDIDEVSVAVTESPHYSGSRRDGAGSSSVTSAGAGPVRGAGRPNFSRTPPSPAVRNIVSPGSLTPMMGAPSPLGSASTSGASSTVIDSGGAHAATGGERRSLSSSLRQSSYHPVSPVREGALGGRRGSTRRITEKLEA